MILEPRSGARSRCRPWRFRHAVVAAGAAAEVIGLVAAPTGGEMAEGAGRKGDWVGSTVEERTRRPLTPTRSIKMRRGLAIFAAV